MARVLVLTTVHQSEDPRIRRRTVGVLAGLHGVVYASPPPGPQRRAGEGFAWQPLAGPRPLRWLRAWPKVFAGDVDLVSLHDPETVPIGIAAAVLRRRPVIVDVHEDVPAQLRTKPWLARPLRRPAAWLAARLLRAAERVATVTLAEPNYAHLFARSHPVLPNYPEVAALPAPADSDGSVVYVGDVTLARGALLAVDAVAGLAEPRPRLRLIGRCDPALAARLRARADAGGVPLDLPGFLPHPEAMAAVARAAVGLSPLADEPNYRASLPTKTLEYAALGVPVLASDLPGTRAVLDGLAGVRLLTPGVPAVWTAALAEVLADPTVRARAQAGSAEVRARFAWPAADLLAVVEAALGGPAN